MNEQIEQVLDSAVEAAQADLDQTHTADPSVPVENADALVEEPATSTDSSAQIAFVESELLRAVEATLFASEESLSAEQVAQHLGMGDKGTSQVKSVLTQLQSHYEGRGILLVERGKYWHFETAPDLAHLLRREKEDVRRLSRAATEVLAIVAYHEPVSRAEIEAIRGVQTAKGTLDVLMEAGWVRVAGRREVPGRPVIYATTPIFLDHFGLTSLRELPGLDELRAAGLLDQVNDEMVDAAIQTSKQAAVSKEKPEAA